MHTYEEDKLMKEAIELEVSALSQILHRFPRGALGLVREDIKRTDAYKEASSQYAAAFAKLRGFNERFVKKYAKEIRAERDARRQQLTTNV